MKYKVFDIVWDIQESIDENNAEEILDLPIELIITVDEEDEIVDAITDHYGYCISSLDYSPIEWLDVVVHR